MAGALEGLRIFDLGGEIAGAFAALWLADLDANVLRWSSRARAIGRGGKVRFLTTCRTQRSAAGSSACWLHCGR
jgi:crotonobetainyl-CoA:carnitine CoA-transferase CaiB-like acyl-CoA transferase